MLGERFSEALDCLKISSKELAEMHGYSEQYIKTLRKAKKMSNTLSGICSHLQININWIVTGKGEMFVGEIDISNLKVIKRRKKNIRKKRSSIFEPYKRETLKFLEKDVSFQNIYTVVKNKIKDDHVPTYYAFYVWARKLKPKQKQDAA